MLPRVMMVDFVAHFCSWAGHGARVSAAADHLCRRRWQVSAISRNYSQTRGTDNLLSDALTLAHFSSFSYRYWCVKFAVSLARLAIDATKVAEFCAVSFNLILLASNVCHFPCDTSAYLIDMHWHFFKYCMFLKVWTLTKICSRAY